MDDWQVQTLEEVCSRVTVGHVGSMASRYVSQGIPFLRSQNVKPGKLDLTSLKYIDSDFHAQLRKSALRAGDLVIVRTGEPGIAAVVPDDIGDLNCSDLVIARPAPGVNVRFLCYAINETSGSYVSAHTVGAVQQHFNVASAKRLTLRLPPASEQGAIVEVLGGLDSKIAVNERIAGTALELAHESYLSAANSATTDWETVELGVVARWLSGGTPKTSKSDFWGGAVPWISATSLKSPWITDSDRRLTALGAQSGTRLVPSESVIFVVRGSSLKTEFRIGLTQREVAFGQDCKALLPSEGRDSHVLFHAIRSSTPRILEMVDETSIGAGRLSTDLIARLAVRMPNNAARDETASRLRSLDGLAARHEDESRALVALRDTLLPQLMSGKLRVRDAERIVEDAV